MGLVQNAQDASVQSPFRTFLQSYCENTRKKVIVLDKREFIYARTVTTVSSVVEIWRRLVARADALVMRPRRKNFSTAQKWRLRWDAGENDVRDGPTYFIVHVSDALANGLGRGGTTLTCLQWIRTYLRAELALTPRSDYSKRQFTVEDIRVAITTLWSLAALVPCSRDTRMSMTSVIQIGGVGGFRPGTLKNLKFSQFDVIILRNGAGVRKLAVVASIRRSKMDDRQRASGRRCEWYVGTDSQLLSASSHLLPCRSIGCAT